MATKLKSFSRSIITKLALSFFVVASSAVLAGTLCYAFFNGMTWELLFESNYLNTQQHASEVSYPLYVVGREFDQGASALTLEDLRHLLGDDIPYDYYFSNGEREYTNVPGKDKTYFSTQATSYLLEGSTFTAGEKANRNVQDYYGMEAFSRFNTVTGYKAYLAFPDEYIAQQQAQWENNHAHMMTLLYQAIACAAVWFFCLVWLMIVTGKKKEDEEIHLCWLDKIYTEAVIGAGVLLAAMPLSFYYDSGIVSSSYYWMKIYVTAAIAGVCSAGLLALFLSLVRRLKSRTFLKQCLVYKAVHTGFRFIASLFDGRRFKKYRLYKDMVFRELVFVTSELVLLLLTLAMAGSVLMLAPLGVALAVLFFFFKGRNEMFADMGKLIDQIEEISEGGLDSAPCIAPSSPLYDSSQRLADIGSGLQKSLEKQIKDERMKIDLITNVSHDLKTPLTSIIGYIDLMEKEEGLSPEMQDYVQILSKKAARLKSIVSDLFDLAKSTSGNAEIEMERLDLCKLVIQTLVDMEDKIQASGQRIKTQLPETPVYVLADGKKLYRVFQNIIENALKYSLPGTRIFIQLALENGRVYAMVKNTASYEMNFTADEILERFSRGDKARTTDGSGLGLSIAESFTQICGGRFYVVVDGDQFKTSIVFDVIE